jgi:hypothetical protein
VKTKDIVALLKEGKQPLVKLTGSLWDDSWGDKGMIARIVGFRENHDDGEPMVEIEFDYNDHKAHNLALQSHGYYIWEDGRDTGKTGTAFEAGMMKEDNIHEGVHFMLECDGAEVPVELADSPTRRFWQNMSSLGQSYPT